MNHEKNNIQLNINKKIFSYIGLAMKGRKLVSGEFATEKAVKSKQALLVLVAEDASNNTKKKFTNMCTYYNVPLYFFGKKEELGKAIGKDLRSSLAFIDRGLADEIRMQLDINDNGNMLENTIEPKKWR